MATGLVFGTYAVGILIGVQHLTQDDAFNVLRMTSQNSNRKISDLAGRLAHTGALPATSSATRAPRPAAWPSFPGPLGGAG